jgi:thioesterase domain-containing protein
MWCVAGGGGTALAFRALAIALGPDQPIMVLEANGLQHRGRPDWTVESAARRFVRAIRVEQPIGPYRIAGFSYGGLVAYEIGRRLRAAGEQVEFVALLDAPTPGVSSRTLAEAIGGDRDGRHSPGRTRRVRRAMQVATAGIRPRMSTEYFGRFLLIAERAARHYRPPSTTLPLVVVEAVFTDAGYWRSLADDVDVTQVPTTHLTLLQPPHVEDVAAVLKRRLVQY